jgi:very-short-patch-repair endonuclease
MRRDREADEALLGLGWTVLRFWDFEVRNDLEGCVSLVANAVRGSRPTAREMLPARVTSASVPAA